MSNLQNICLVLKNGHESKFEEIKCDRHAIITLLNVHIIKMPSRFLILYSKTKTALESYWRRFFVQCMVGNVQIYNGYLDYPLSTQPQMHNLHYSPPLQGSETIMKVGAEKYKGQKSGIIIEK